jgi:hypothetical protein
MKLDQWKAQKEMKLSRKNRQSISSEKEVEKVRPS